MIQKFTYQPGTFHHSHTAYDLHTVSNSLNILQAVKLAKEIGGDKASKELGIPKGTYILGSKQSELESWISGKDPIPLPAH